MIKEIIHDVHFLSQKSTPATSADIQAVRDLKATFIANFDRAAGLAANMIGIHKRIIVFGLGKLPVMMINPEIIAQDTPYQTTEGCLSLDGFGQRNASSTSRLNFKTNNSSGKPKISPI